jgi:signal transduction histidine kinase
LRLARKLALVVSTLVALILLVTRSRVRDADAYNRALDGARHLRELDALLDRAALQAWGGMTLDYDELIDVQREMDLTQRGLEKSPIAQDPLVSSRLTEARAFLGRTEATVETFQSRNSAVRNSIIYFPAAVRAADILADASAFGDSLRAHATELLEDAALYRTGRATEHINQFRAHLATLAAMRWMAPPAVRDAIDLVLNHGRLIADSAPKVDESIHLLISTQNNAYDDLYLAIRSLHDDAIEQANGFRAGLVAFCVVLLAAIGAMFLRLRRNAAALRAALTNLAREKEVVDQKQQELANLNKHLETRVAERTRELAGNKEQYRLLLETTQAIPWEMEPGALRFSYVGPQAAHVLGYPLDEWTKERFVFERLDPLYREGALARLQSCLARNGYHEVELCMVAFDGKSVWLRCFIRTTRDGSPASSPILRGILLDVTAQRQLESELRAAQKLESVGRLAAGIAHEINTPVQFVSDSVHFVSDAFTELAELVASYRALAAAVEQPEREPGQTLRLAQQARATEERVDLDYSLEHIPKALERSLEGLGRIGAIVRSMKEYAHPDRKEKAAIDLNKNIESTLIIARGEFKHVADLQTDYGALPPICCYAGEVNQMILNVVVNAAHAIADAVKGTEARGRITVRTRSEGPDVLVSIEDTGNGIPAHARDKIFEPFFTTKEVGRGTGQGLAIAHSVVEKHGGRISFETEMNVGTTFLIRLPIAEGAKPSPVKTA